MATETTSLDAFRSNLLKSVRKGHKQHKQKVEAQKLTQELSHRYHFNHCLDCGKSCFDEPKTGICPRSPAAKK